MKRLLALALSLCAAFTMWAGDHVRQTDILYKGTPDAYTEKMCRLDVAYEEGAEGRPVIVWFHSGGLTSGWRHIPETLLRDGAVVVGVGYRFVTEVSLEETLDDAAAADRIFSILMGEEVEPRKQWIEENAKYVVNLDI